MAAGATSGRRTATARSPATGSCRWTQLPALLAQDDGPDALTVDASLVALDALLRLGTIAADDPMRPALERLGAIAEPKPPWPPPD